MLVGFENANLVKEYLAKVPEKDRTTLFNTQMQVTFPSEWETYRQNGKFDPAASNVTVLGFYYEGQKRGYEVSTELNMLRSVFGAYILSEPAKPATAITSAQRAPASTASNARPNTPSANKTPSRDAHAPVPNQQASRQTAPPVSKPTRPSLAQGKPQVQAQTHASLGGTGSVPGRSTGTSVTKSSQQRTASGPSSSKPPTG
ncbi:hypothetical protein VTI74DRAFT_2938 [Chaetomium olivicolor]